MPLFALEALTVDFRTDDGVLRAVDGVSLAVEAGEIVCLVGESGSGKSTVALAAMGLLPQPAGRVTSGAAWLDDDGARTDLVQAGERALARLRGRRLAMIFQDPMTSLNPYLTVGAQLSEVLELHEGLAHAAARARSTELLRQVGIPAPESRLDEHPHRLSGGMRQRVMIAMALACRPKLLFADEPTTALDVTVQAQILELLCRERDAVGCGILLITHDLGVVARVADRVAVMYAGRIVEAGPAREVLRRPRHPYTLALLRAVPRVDAEADAEALVAIPGAPPSPLALPTGCAFHPRCALAEARCRETRPEERRTPTAAGDVRLRCHVETSP
ncbi:MAG: ABC transporter ATP-binding protein [Myxococcales bacterium]|nr:ABC transporter ATP-binding protein [Myxococcales bacterium]